MSASEKELEMSDEEFGTNCELVKDFINVRIEWLLIFKYSLKNQIYLISVS